jgi:DNA polymerase-1
VPEDVLFKYAALDTCYTEAAETVIDSLMNDDNRHVYETILLPAANMLLDVSRVGMRVDTSKLGELRVEYVKKVEDLAVKLYELAGTEFNPSSPMQVKPILQERLGGRIVSTDRKVLDEHSDDEFVKTLLEFRTAKKLLTTYIDGLEEDLVDGVMHPSLRLNGTTTGRLSSKDAQFGD